MCVCVSLLWQERPCIPVWGSCDSLGGHIHLCLFAKFDFKYLSHHTSWLKQIAGKVLLSVEHAVRGMAALERTSMFHLLKYMTVTWICNYSRFFYILKDDAELKLWKEHSSQIGKVQFSLINLNILFSFIAPDQRLQQSTDVRLEHAHTLTHTLRETFEPKTFVQRGWGAKYVCLFQLNPLVWYQKHTGSNTQATCATLQTHMVACKSQSGCRFRFIQSPSSTPDSTAFIWSLMKNFAHCCFFSSGVNRAACCLSALLRGIKGRVVEKGENNCHSFLCSSVQRKTQYMGHIAGVTLD